MYHSFPDISSSRLEFAKKMGADNTILVEKASTEKDLSEKIKSELNSAPDVSIECSGAESSVRLAILVSTLETYI